MTDATCDTIGAIRRRSLIALFAFVCAVTCKAALVRWLVLGRVGLAGLALDATFILIVFVAADLFFADMRFRAMIVVDAALSLLLLAVAMYVSYYQALPTREALLAVGQAGAVSSSIANLFSPAYLLLFADIPVAVAWVTRSRRRGVDPLTGNPPGALAVPGLRTPYIYQRRTVYVIGVAALVCFAVAVNSARALPASSDALAVARERGLTTYIVADLLGSTVKESADEGSPSAIHAEVDALRGDSADARVKGFVSGSARGKNVIVIQVESLQNAALGARMGGVEVTPNLSRFAARSFFFPNHFSVAGRGTTSDAEFAVNTSLYPPTAGAASLMYVDRILPSLPRTLAGMGYASYTFHTNTAEFWNRTQLYPAIGFTGYFDQAYFGTDDKIGMGASDRVLFDKTLKELRTLDASHTPYYAQVITLSSHFPFVSIPASQRSLAPVPPYVGTIEGDYLTEMHYADAEIGRFLDSLEAAGMLDDTIVVIYGDHFGLPMPRSQQEADAVRTLLGRDITPVDRLNTPLIIHMPRQSEGATVTTPVSQMDLVPTLADALGVDLSEDAVFGKSDFATGARLFSAGALVSPGSYFDKTTLYVSDSTSGQESAYNVESRQEVAVPAASVSKREKVLKMLDLSAKYVAGLPRRGDYDAHAKSIIPGNEGK